LATVPFTISVVDDHGEITVVLGGDVDIATVGEVRRALAEAIEAAHRRVVVDLHRVEYLDSSGIKALVRANIRARVTGKELRVRGADGAVRRILELTGIDHVLDVDESPRPGEAGAATT